MWARLVIHPRHQVLDSKLTNFWTVLHFQSKATANAKPIDDTNGDKGRPEPQIEVHETVELSLEGAQSVRTANSQSAALAVEAALEAVQEAIDRLQRLAIIIRRSSSVTIASRVKNYALKTDAAENDEFNKLILMRLNGILPAMSESLAGQLLESIAHRRLRLLYQRRHQKKLARRRPSRSNQVVPGETEEPKPKSDPPLQPAMPEAGTSKVVGKTSVYSKSQANSDTAHSTFNLSAFHRHQSRTASVQPDSITVTSVAQGCSYPRPPRLQDGGKTARCDWCCEEIQASQVQTSGWWRYSASAITTCSNID